MRLEGGGQLFFLLPGLLVRFFGATPMAGMRGFGYRCTGGVDPHTNPRHNQSNLAFENLILTVIGNKFLMLKNRVTSGDRVPREPIAIFASSSECSNVYARFLMGTCLRQFWRRPGFIAELVAFPTMDQRRSERR